MNNLWFPPPPDAVKLNVHGVMEEVPVENGNMNSIGITARDHDGNLLGGVMGPLTGSLEGFESQIWAIHLAMKLAFKSPFTHVYIECDNVEAFNMLVDQDQEELEAEGLTGAVQQINILFSEFNKPRANFAEQRSCRIYSVFATRSKQGSYIHC